RKVRRRGRIRDVMHGVGEVLTTDTSLREAAKQLKRDNAKILPVCENGAMVGVLTTRQLLMRALSRGLDPFTSRVGEVMGRRIIYCSDDLNTREAGRIMRKVQIPELFVLDRNMHLVGKVFLEDVN